MKKIIILIFLLISIINMGYSQNYADITINVQNNGAITIDGTTNYKEFNNITNSQEFTSKNGKFWTLNITTKESLDNFIFELILPKGTTINYIKTTPTFRIEEENNQIHIIGTGENKPLTLILQYQITPIKTSNENEITIILLMIILFFTLSLITYLGIKLNKNKDKKENLEEKNNNEEIDYSILPQRQQDIIKILKKEGKITQKNLEKIMSIPKSSISRNVKTLVVKNIVKKESIGNTNYLSLIK